MSSIEEKGENVETKGKREGNAESADVRGKKRDRMLEELEEGKKEGGG